MDFMNNFDNAVSKAKEVIDVACKKTGEVVSTQKQKFDAVTLESKREKDYAALGEIYYGMIKDAENADKTVAELVSAIKEKTAKIDELHSEINAAKNKRVCPSCGAYIDSTSVYCNTCGAKVVIDSSEEK